ncbi:MAG: histidine kinase [Methylibium sp. NZG]|nr:MAG: histidine kinase [Methylibium sp. NZG]
MSRPLPQDDARATPAARASELPTTGFGPTLLDAPGSLAAARADATSVFDVCHVGVVLRALLLVHAVVAVGVMFVASGWQAWVGLLTTGSALALPGVLLWLLVACALKRPLGALPLAGQWAAAMGLGAASALGGALLAWFPMPDEPLAGHWLAAALAGAGLAAVMFQWLHLRAQAAVPAETSARLAELQSRIRPHFLFNTLNTALTLVRLDPARAEGLLEDLAELFRVALGDSGEATTLDDEVELARRYLAIEQIRFGDRLKVVWELDPAAGSARVPPLLLQPLVENAVRHGVEPAAEGGAIRVRTRVNLGRAVVSIVNSVPAAGSRPGNGMALVNVRERLRLMHDVAASFDTRQEGGMFRVQIVLPL